MRDLGFNEVVLVEEPLDRKNSLSFHIYRGPPPPSLFKHWTESFSQGLEQEATTAAILPFIDGSYNKLGSGILQNDKLFAEDGDIYYDVKVMEKNINNLRLVCRTWAAILANSRNRCVMTNLNTFNLPGKSTFSYPPLDTGAPSEIPWWRDFDNEQLKEILANVRILVIRHLSIDLKRFLDLMPGLRAFSLSMNSRFGIISMPSTYISHHPHLTHLSLSDIKWKQFAEYFSVKGPRFLSLRYLDINFTNSPRNSISSQDERVDWSISQLDSLIFRGSVEENTREDFKSFIGKCGQTVTEFIDFGPYREFHEPSSIPFQDHFPYLSTYGTCFSFLIEGDLTTPGKESSFNPGNRHRLLILEGFCPRDSLGPEEAASRLRAYMRALGFNEVLLVEDALDRQNALSFAIFDDPPSPALVELWADWCYGLLLTHPISYNRLSTIDLFRGSQFKGKGIDRRVPKTLINISNMTESAVQRTPIEVWTLILHHAIATPLLPFVDEAHKHLSTSVIRTIDLFCWSESCDVYKKCRDMENAIKSLRLSNFGAHVPPSFQSIEWQAGRISGAVSLKKNQPYFQLRTVHADSVFSRFSFPTTRQCALCEYGQCGCDLLSCLDPEDIQDCILSYVSPSSHGEMGWEWWKDLKDERIGEFMSQVRIFSYPNHYFHRKEMFDLMPRLQALCLGLSNSYRPLATLLSILSGQSRLTHLALHSIYWNDFATYFSEGHCTLQLETIIIHGGFYIDKEYMDPFLSLWGRTVREYVDNSTYLDTQRNKLVPCGGIPPDHYFPNLSLYGTLLEAVISKLETHHRSQIATPFGPPLRSRTLLLRDSTYLPAHDPEESALQLIVYVNEWNFAEVIFERRWTWLLTRLYFDKSAEVLEADARWFKTFFGTLLKEGLVPLDRDFISISDERYRMLWE
ncbi:11563_t:CDS:2 [Acaulospora colombiana]|uniref:11563_t:CDS:1 n=1 Tax=Acaulospora colombiana TaxID=27376 RepID=A0ACA9LC18_9GLOM|nr:11563_t:CDS:2 [Acaulospora colombiana]